jgi:integrase/recombinase XerD
MATPSTDAPISPLRQRMQHDMLMRGLGSHTRQDYVRHVRCFAAFLGRSPDTATPDDIRRFQLDQHEKGVGPACAATINGAVSALRFLFLVTLQRRDLSRALVITRYHRKLPDVLSVEEAGRLLEAAPGLKYKAALGVAYGAGLRVSEVAHLKVDDVDSTRMLLRVEQGKGRKDRNAMLSPQLLELLRLWWREGRRRGVMLPHGWLFPGRSRTDPVSSRQLHRAVQEAAEVAGIRKRVSPHTLRHSFATHLLEQDVDIRVIQVLLGHSKLETTALYAKVSTRTIHAVTGPLDRLMALMEGKSPPE